jgi:hypothetical protein
MVVRLAAQSVSSELGKERCRKSGPQMAQFRLCWSESRTVAGDQDENLSD